MWGRWQVGQHRTLVEHPGLGRLTSCPLPRHGTHDGVSPPWDTRWSLTIPPLWVSPFRLCAGCPHMPRCLPFLANHRWSEAAGQAFADAPEAVIKRHTGSEARRTRAKVGLGRGTVVPARCVRDLLHLRHEDEGEMRVHGTWRKAGQACFMLQVPIKHYHINPLCSCTRRLHGARLPPPWQTWPPCLPASTRARPAHPCPGGCSCSWVTLHGYCQFHCLNVTCVNGRRTMSMLSVLPA